uniref:Uncharacterized protein n=1 Tax=Lactuca sativa TaxID=4236 RepID=A0A9R1V516_LACSA|nr:hypothetical protein LSAT_V11C600314490 [Lactuca sativa]
MEVFRAQTEAIKQVKGDYEGQYALLKDYAFKHQSCNPETTVKTKVETQPNPSSKTRTFKRVYVCLGPLKKAFAAGKRDYLGLDRSFMKGPYRRTILTTTILLAFI